MIVTFYTFIKMIFKFWPQFPKLKSHFFLPGHIFNLGTSIRILSGLDHRAAYKNEICCNYVKVGVPEVHLAPRWDNVLFRKVYQIDIWILITQSLPLCGIIKSLLKKKNPMIFLSNDHRKPLNQSCKKVDQDPEREMVMAIFPKSHNNGSTF